MTLRAVTSGAHRAMSTLVLARGARGPSVVDLQRRLAAKGFNPGAIVKVTIYGSDGRPVLVWTATAAAISTASGATMTNVPATALAVVRYERFQDLSERTSHRSAYLHASPCSQVSSGCTRKTTKRAQSNTGAYVSADGIGYLLARQPVGEIDGHGRR